MKPGGSTSRWVSLRGGEGGGRGGGEGGTEEGTKGGREEGKEGGGRNSPTYVRLGFKQ